MAYTTLLHNEVMLALSRILLPVDFSERCLGMVHYARPLLERYRAELTLLHVVNPVFVAPETGISAPVLLPVPEWMIEQETKKLDDFGRKDLGGLLVRRLVYEGEPEAQIVEVAKAEKVDLLVMPTHGVGAFRRFLLGSVTAKVLDDVACPVITGTHLEKLAHANPSSISSVVCGADPTEEPSHPLEWAARLAADFGARLSVIHSVSYIQKNRRPVYVDEVLPQIKEWLGQQLGKLEGEIGLKASDVEVAISDSGVADAVCDFAKSADADLVVIGRARPSTHPGRLNTNAYNIIRQSLCPVLSV